MKNQTSTTPDVVIHEYSDRGEHRLRVNGVAQLGWTDYREPTQFKGYMALSEYFGARVFHVGENIEAQEIQVCPDCGEPTGWDFDNQEFKGKPCEHITAKYPDLFKWVEG